MAINVKEIGMRPIITLCSSAKFFDKLNEIKIALEKQGYEVFLPSMTDYHGLEETALAKIQNNLIRDHFDKISKSNAIYVANYEKNGVKGYIGGSVLLEMGMAFSKKIPIFLMNEIPAQTELAVRISKDLKKRGFGFLGPTIVYSHMQATGLVNDHLTYCFRHDQLLQ